MIKGFFVIIQTLLLLTRVTFTKQDKRSIVVFFQSSHVGGGRTYFFALMKFLKQNNYQAKLFFTAEDYDEGIEQFCRIENIPFSVYQPARQTFFTGKLFSIGFIKYFYNYLRQLNVVIRAVAIHRSKRVIVSSGWPFQSFFTLLLPGQKFFIQHVMPLHPIDKGNFFFLKLALFLRQGTFISVSDFAQQKMRQFWLGSYRKVITIYNFYEKKTQEIKVESPNLLILSLARVEDGKNPLMWIDIAKELLAKYPDLKFTWAGKGSLLEEAKKRTSQIESIRFVGFVEDVEPLYREAAIYFEPSKREAHGISVVGAMAWGLPVVATDNGGTLESVIDSETGYTVDVNNYSIMVERLETLILNKKLRHEMGEKAISRYQNMFTKELWEQKMHKALSLEK